MKLLAFLVCSMFSVVLFNQIDVSYGFDLKQSLTAIKFMLSTGLNSLHMKFNSLFKSTSGKFPVEDTPLIMNYFAHDCDLHIGKKRSIFDNIVYCKADVTEAVTGTSRSCVKPTQMAAVQCATRLILEKLESDINKEKDTLY